MDWNGNLRVPNFVSRPPETSLSFLYNYNNYHDQFPDTSMTTKLGNNGNGNGGMMMNNNNNNNNNGYVDPKKKRLSNEQLEMLENNFHEEIKLDPDRKMKLAKELGLQPRQIAVWFQNRRARWKSKQLERLYDALKHEYDVVSRDKLKLQQEVMALRAILNKEQIMVGKKQISSIGGYTEISGEETMESTSSDQNQNPQQDPTAINNNLQQQINYADDINSNQDNYTLTTMEFHDHHDGFNNNNTVPILMPPYWPASATLP